VLGELIDKPQPLRLADLGQHPTSYGFPAGHPVMHSFLGVPIVIRGHVWGNLYLTEKAGGEFTEADEDAVVILAVWASTAIENAQLYERSERRRRESGEYARGLEATRDVVVAIGEEIALENVLELIAKRGRALVDARSVVIMLRDGDELVVQTSVGHARAMRGFRMPIAGSTSGQVLERHVPERISDVSSRLRIAPGEFGVADPHTALLVPMLYRGEEIGILAAFDRGDDNEVFSEEDERTLRAFAVSTATAVAIAQSVVADRLRSSLASAEGERRRWARELHDETLQNLGALHMLLVSGLANPEELDATVNEAADLVRDEVVKLRHLIAELRPAVLDQVGLEAALESLGRKVRVIDGLEVDLNLEMSQLGRSLSASDESVLYRAVQEALANAAKHSAARRVEVTIRAHERAIEAIVADDGVGFEAESISDGFGLIGMRERAMLVGGELEVQTAPGAGTSIRFVMPLGEAVSIEDGQSSSP
jgi:signal transduction histidine kinase